MFVIMSANMKSAWDIQMHVTHGNTLSRSLNLNVSRSIKHFDHKTFDTLKQLKVHLATSCKNIPRSHGM
jgi:hypothetical protein